MKNFTGALSLLSVCLLLSSAAHAAGQGGKLREACKDDAHSFCSDVKPGGGRIISCLKDHTNELSGSCASALQNMPARGPKGDAPAPKETGADNPPDSNPGN